MTSEEGTFNKNRGKTILYRSRRQKYFFKYDLGKCKRNVQHIFDNPVMSKQICTDNMPGNLYYIQS